MRPLIAVLVVCVASAAPLGAATYDPYSPKRSPVTFAPGAYGGPTQAVAWRAEPRRPVAIRASPSRRARITAQVGVRTPARNVTRLLVTGSVRASTGDEWIKVMVSGGPTPVEGWVLRGLTRLSSTRVRIELDLASRRMRLLVAGRPVLHAAAAIGAIGTPTPPGRYAVREVARLGRVDGRALGPFAVGLNAVTATPNELRGADRRLALIGLGRNSRALLGRPTTLGTIRVSDRALSRLARYVRSGVPVDILVGPVVAPTDPSA